LRLGYRTARGIRADPARETPCPSRRHHWARHHRGNGQHVANEIHVEIGLAQHPPLALTRSVVVIRICFTVPAPHQQLRIQRSPFHPVSAQRRDSLGGLEPHCACTTHRSYRTTRSSRKCVVRIGVSAHISTRLSAELSCFVRRQAKGRRFRSQSIEYVVGIAAERVARQGGESWTFELHAKAHARPRIGRLPETDGARDWCWIYMRRNQNLLLCHATKRRGGTKASRTQLGQASTARCPSKTREQRNTDTTRFF